MAYTVIDKPSDYFTPTIYTGTGSSQSIDTGFAPDWVWIKKRSGTANNCLYDTIRGATKTLHSDVANGESTDAQLLTAFETDGFTVGTGANVNESSATFVSWNWKAGTAFTNDASATGVGSIDSAGSVNTDAGFSIVSWTGTGSNGTLAHGLGSVPKMIIVKNRDGTQGWGVYHASLGNTKYLQLNASAAVGTASTFWNNTTPTSSVFSIGTSGWMNDSSNKYIAYIFSDVKGYQKSGSFIGNGNANGSYTHLGFSPAFLFLKNTADSGGNWQLFDNKRDPNNVANHRLFPSLSNAENSDTNNNIDFLSNGFKMRTSNGDTNSNGVTFIYYAVASSPFTTSTGIPATAK